MSAREDNNMNQQEVAPEATTTTIAAAATTTQARIPETSSEDKNVDTNADSNNLNNGVQVLYLEQYRPPFWGALILVPFLLPLFWQYHVRVTKDDVSFGYSHSTVQKITKLTNVQVATPIEHIRGLVEWGGWGLRLRHDATGYIAKNGKGIHLTITEDNRTKVYVFNCDDPQTVCDLLNPTNTTTQNE